MELKEKALRIWEQFNSFKEDLSNLSAEALKAKMDTDYKLDGVADSLIDFKEDLGIALEEVFGISVFDSEDEE